MIQNVKSRGDGAVSLVEQDRRSRRRRVVTPSVNY